MKEAVYFYNGRRFRTVRDARWAAFFDACGVRYKHMPKAVHLGPHAVYQPTFLLDRVLVSHCVYDTAPEMLVTSAGCMNNETAMLIRRCVAQSGVELDDMAVFPSTVLIVGSFPSGEKIDRIIESVEKKASERHPGWPDFYSFETIDGRRETAFPGLSYRGKLVLFGTDPGYLGDMDPKATEAAYRAAREAQLEYRIIQR